ncbi:MAG: helix-turn-helix domain-containing protein [Bacteroidota bacterium]
MSHLISFIFIIGFALCGFIILGLFKNKREGLPQRLLIVFWVYVLFIILTYYADLYIIKWLYAISFPFLNTAQIFLPVLIYLYFKSIFFKQDQFFRMNLIHLLPSMLYALLYTAPLLINYISDSILFPYVEGIDTVEMTLYKDIYGILYFILSIRLLGQVKGKLVHIFSELSELEFAWLFKFVYTFFGVIILDFLFTLSEFLWSYDANWDGYVVVVMLILSMFYLAYYGIHQVSHFIPEFLFEPQKKKIASQDFATLALQLKQLMEEEKPYLNPKLSLRELAEKMRISDKHLSMMLNNELELSFYDLVNAYRVKEAKQKLMSMDLEKYTVTGIGNMCGFSSKSSFYRVFKNETGITPLSYIKRERT